MDVVFDAVHWKRTGNYLMPRVAPLPVAGAGDVRLGVAHLTGEGNARIPAAEHVEEDYAYDMNDSVLGTFSCGGGTALATPTLTVPDIDLASGATVTATISAATDGTTNAVYYKLRSQSAWILGGTRSGNGTISLTLPVGTYDARVTSTLDDGSTLSSQVKFVVSNSATAKQYYRVKKVEWHPGLLHKELVLEKIDRPVNLRMT